MRSIPTIFRRAREDRYLVIDKPISLVSWVFTGKGIPTRKYDGIAIKVEGGKVFRRVEWVGLPMPNIFIRVQDPDPRRPNSPVIGWVPVPESFKTSPKGTDERALRQAWDWLLSDLRKIAFNNKKETKISNPYAPVQKEADPVVPDGTYELCGPNIRGNHEKFKSHVLLAHGAEVLKNVPRTFENLKKYLETFDGEGIVWHYRTGNVLQMAKIKRKDFGFNTRIAKEDLEMAYKSNAAQTTS